MTELLSIFLNVLAPVFLLVLLGYIAGKRLRLEARTLSRYAYFILTPAFVFNELVGTAIAVGLVVQMSIYMVAVQLCCAAIAWLLARLLRRPASMTAIYVAAAVFGNVGNFGFPIIQFALGDDALDLATIYFLIVMVVSFIIGVVAFNWERGGGLGATLAVLKTPGLMVVPIAVFFNWTQIELPLMVSRPIELLAGGLIPTMLIALGVQLASAGIPRPNLDMLMASLLRLVVSPLLAIGLALPLGISGLAREVGILQASMPIAVLVTIIAAEYETEPAFVTASVLFSTLLSVVTLAIVAAFLGS
jgi:hypothetical protein